MNIAVALTMAAIATTPSLTPEQRAEARYARTGGEILQRDAYKGKVVFANATGLECSNDVIKVVSFLKDAFPVNICAAETSTRDPNQILIDNKATATIVLIKDTSSPTVLIAPVERWAVVNTARIVDDLPAENAKDRFKAPRIRKLLIKTFSELFGSAASQFPGNIMNTATVRELDHCHEQMPIDVIDKVNKYFKDIGITPAEYTTYRKACKEGWAPTPTNEVQKAIWEQVRAIPTEPIKIKP